MTGLAFDPEPFEHEILGGAFTSLTPSEQKALAITSTLETGHAGSFEGMTGNFDGQGLSFGLVNWTIGTGSLQPLLRDFAKAFPDRWAAVFGPHAGEFLAVITPKDTKPQLQYAVDHMNTHDATGWHLVEPWLTYLKRLAADPEFQKIELRYVRDLLSRGRYFCEYFGLRSERAFCFMFDAVASHGKWWISVKGREGMVKSRLAALGGKPTEAQVMTAIAEVLRDTSLERFRAHVYARKRWFVVGAAAGYNRAKEIAAYAPTDAPYTTSDPRAFDNVIAAPAVITELVRGERDPSKLATAGFYAVHPERNRRPIARGETEAIDQWKRLRDGVVKQLLADFTGT